MKLSNLTATDIQKLAQLIAKRDLLSAQLALAESEIDSFAGDAPSPRAGENESINGAKLFKVSTRRTRVGGKRGKIKQAILEALEKAGSNGLSVRELSDSLKIKSANLYSWFYATGRKISQIKKSEDGRYSIK